MSNHTKQKKNLTLEIERAEKNVRLCQENLEFLKKRLENLDKLAKPVQKFMVTFLRVVEARTEAEALELLSDVVGRSGDACYPMFPEDHFDTKIVKMVDGKEVERDLQPGEIK